MTCLFREECYSSLFLLDYLISRYILLGCGGKVGDFMDEELTRVLLHELYLRRLQDVVTRMVDDLERMRLLLEQLDSE